MCNSKECLRQVILVELPKLVLLLGVRSFGLCGLFVVGDLVFIGRLASVLVFTCGFLVDGLLLQRFRELGLVGISDFILLFAFFLACFLRLFFILIPVRRFFVEGCQQVLHPLASSEPFYVAGPAGLF
ncbi:MAG: hypothetical protein JWO71_2241 [Candidatus Acidoferrum typicum]|nr:hypothetical protein [Candidatus Acidoferrum typicum]